MTFPVQPPDLGALVRAINVVKWTSVSACSFVVIACLLALTNGGTWVQGGDLMVLGLALIAGLWGAGLWVLFTWCEATLSILDGLRDRHSTW